MNFENWDWLIVSLSSLQKSLISFEYVDFYAKIFLILYLWSWNSITGNAILEDDAGRFIERNSRTIIAGFGQVTNRNLTNLRGLSKKQKFMRKTKLNLCEDFSNTQLCGTGSRGMYCDNYVLQWQVNLDNELSWMFPNRLSVTR